VSKWLSILFFSFLFCASAFAADAYEIRDILRKGGYVTVSDEFDRYDVKDIIRAAARPDYVTVRSKGFNSYDIREFTDLGARIQ